MQCPDSHPVLMSDVLGSCLPDELLHAILIRLDDHRFSWERPPKRGLAPCSLTCRHWAKLIRPILFEYLTIRSAEDVSQLLALLGVPDFLGRTLQSCIRCLDLVEDRTSSSIPWGHRCFLWWFRQTLSVDVTWTIRGASADDQLQQTQRLSLLPSALLPRALPTSTVLLHRVTLSNLQVPSVRSLTNFIKRLSFRELTLDNVGFPEENPGHLPRRRPRSSRISQDSRSLSVLNCIGKSSSLPFWITFCNTLLADQFCPRLDDDTEASLAKHFRLFASLHQCEDDISKLEVSYNSEFPDGESCYVYSLYRAGTEDEFAEARIEKRAGDGVRPYIEHVMFACSDAGGVGMPSELLSQLEAAFTDINGPDIPRLWIKCETTNIVRVLIHGILEGCVLSQLCATHPRKVSVDAPETGAFAAEEILSAPTCVSVGDETISLTAAQRAEWVLLLWDSQRDGYLRELWDAAHTTRAATNTNSEKQRTAGRTIS
ncbi:uncharacterized protein PHACADRAFT_186901 [Phanerochaete carnosa HHB-10118-sp]|uniref:F-box domain-containing protein n=1 Tax=Phanerochaete carnosa (strain HHB-10118-sp) TaxID=650164 RepID=K5WR80_PHACS|nr:uncharacterized protein PHACADRAFT_186901 [Phanerochaete carnosa HHB-10118-sp]EKM52852.1 hypothetical protein PHACADRAFT_186901 [Phanerochaete carnosa HHB-10118-sp]